MKKTKTYILKIECLDGNDVTRSHHEILDENGWNVQEVNALYAIVCVGPQGAEIVDDGYRTLEEAQQSWPEAFTSGSMSNRTAHTEPKKKRP